MSEPHMERIATLSNLQRALDHVRQGGATPGIDRVSPQAYDQARAQRLQVLCEQLQQGTYRPMPGLRFSPACDPGRKLSIPTVEDRVVQRAIAQVLGPFFEAKFLRQSFAYRPGRSIQAAHQRVWQYINEGYTHHLKTDVSSFFDSINRESLLDALRAEGLDEALVRVIRRLITAQAIEGVAFIDANEGIPQGSSLSPLLSNIYLHPVDVAMTEHGFAYLRYADDILVLGRDAQECEDAHLVVGEALATLTLHLSARKTSGGLVSGGFDFLGRRFDSRGISLSRAAHRVVNERLRDAAARGESLPALEAMVEDWESWCGPLRPADCASLELLTAVTSRAAALEDYAALSSLAERRLSMKETMSPALHANLVNIWLAAPPKPELLHAALVDLRCALASDEGAGAVSGFDATTIEALRRHDNWREVLISAGYRELGLVAKGVSTPPNSGGAKSSDAVNLLPEFMEAAAVKGSHLREMEDARGHLQFRHFAKPWKSDDLEAHAAGLRRCAFYLADLEGNTRVAAIDVRVNGTLSRQLRLNGQHEALDKMTPVIESCVQTLEHAARALGARANVEVLPQSGRRLWFVFDDEVHIRQSFRFLTNVRAALGEPPPDIVVQQFPNNDGAVGRRAGYVVCPLGRDPRVGWSGAFRETALHLTTSRDVKLLTRRGSLAPERLREAAQPLIAALADMGGAAEVVGRCSILEQLAAKVAQTGLLEPMEVASLVEILGHLRHPNNVDALRVLLVDTNVQSLHAVRRRLQKLMSHPLGCAKLKERHRDLAARSPCACAFAELPGGCYPTPLLYGMRPQQIAAFSRGGKDRKVNEKRGGQARKNQQLAGSGPEGTRAKFKGKGRDTQQLPALANLVQRYINIHTQIASAKRGLAATEAELRRRVQAHEEDPHGAQPTTTESPQPIVSNMAEVPRENLKTRQRNIREQITNATRGLAAVEAELHRRQGQRSGAALAKLQKRRDNIREQIANATRGLEATEAELARRAQEEPVARAREESPEQSKTMEGKVAGATLEELVKRQLNLGEQIANATRGRKAVEADLRRHLSKANPAVLVTSNGVVRLASDGRVVVSIDLADE